MEGTLGFFLHLVGTLLSPAKPNTEKQDRNELKAHSSKAPEGLDFESSIISILSTFSKVLLEYANLVTAELCGLREGLWFAFEKKY